MAVDRDKTLRTKLEWARIFVRSDMENIPSKINILEGSRSFTIQNLVASSPYFGWSIPERPIPRQVLKGEEAVPHMEVCMETQDDVFDLHG